MSKFRDTKIRILSEEHSKAFQEAVFKDGGSWGGGYKGACHEGEPYLFVDEYLKLTYCTSGVWFKTFEAKEVTFCGNEPVKVSHKHAHLMAQYAEDALTTDKPWEGWEYWSKFEEAWMTPVCGLAFNPNRLYRRKPKMKIIHGVEIPDIGIDLSNVHKGGRVDFYTPSVHRYDFYESYSHHPYNNSVPMSERGITYPYTEEGKQAAILHAKAMLGIAQQKDK